MSKKIIFSGGGTGGHVLPAIHLMKHFFDKKYEVLLVTDVRGNNFVKDKTNHKSYIIGTGTPTNKNLIKKFLSFFVVLNSIIKSIFILKKEKPDLILGFGGYVSFPTCIAARILNLPLIIYESNVKMGRANKYLAPFSKKIFLANKIKNSLPEKYLNKTYEVGSILDKNIINSSSKEKKKIKNKFSILVLGGSQGAKIFGEVVPETINMVNKKINLEIEINQQCILDQEELLVNFYKKNNIKHHIFKFEKNILNFLLESDLVITRCGATTSAELVHTLSPFVAVPLQQSIDNHQYLNAKYHENKGCCWLLEQKNFNSRSLFNLIIEIINSKNKLENIRLNMKKNRSQNVYTNVENEIEELF
jgi:UDP-N-acetylglucosamine--N-acetylmuramyl-(pentapeptide) pyrophosphoryl-undecaprenol N-acetylglucosamine transferase